MCHAKSLPAEVSEHTHRLSKLVKLLELFLPLFFLGGKCIIPNTVGPNLYSARIGLLFTSDRYPHLIKWSTVFLCLLVMQWTNFHCVILIPKRTLPSLSLRIWRRWSETKLIKTRSAPVKTHIHLDPWEAWGEARECLSSWSNSVMWGRSFLRQTRERPRASVYSVLQFWEGRSYITFIQIHHSDTIDHPSTNSLLCHLS